MSKIIIAIIILFVIEKMIGRWPENERYPDEL
jgi:hypothetical protein